MPFIAVAIALVGGVLAVIALMPLSLVLRYRAGTARRPARRWVAAINLVAVGVSATLLLMVAAITSYWIPVALRYALMGLAGGGLLGLLGLGPRVDVIEPASLRERVAAEAAAVVARGRQG